MFEAIADVITEPPRGRRGAPVRRQSRLAGREGVFWRRVSRQEARQIVFAARRYELTSRQFGARNGALGAVALEVLDLLANMVDYKTGRLDPAIETLMKRLKRSRDAIVRALKALRDHGFLDWLRRYVPTGREGRGVQVQQTSNAYRLSMPARARRLLGRYGRSAPLPDDFTHAREMQEAAITAHRQSLTLEELPLFEIGDNPLGQALARLGKAIKERESAKRTESASRFISMKNE
ncbi:helix-turn-helix domain-containing protein [Hoeflea sp. EC-HK425]|uniref:helix-turn-helix domain-containing protein n=1 Tax=Hoeflea sp. EC-HK425 TaxID=2038388 RepID=UPI00125BB1FB|nr:helix-turn-helix domain-containing protein [Hoeflea sp. EC-HK425]VVS99839.1 Replication protein A [Hoeflea sp. EC-HK425]